MLLLMVLMALVLLLVLMVLVLLLLLRVLAGSLGLVRPRVKMPVVGRDVDRPPAEHVRQQKQQRQGVVTRMQRQPELRWRQDTVVRVPAAAAVTARSPTAAVAGIGGLPCVRPRMQGTRHHATMGAPRRCQIGPGRAQDAAAALAMLSTLLLIAACGAPAAPVRPPAPAVPPRTHFRSVNHALAHAEQQGRAAAQPSLQSLMCGPVLRAAKYL